MAQRVADLSTEELEALVERAVERRLQVWFTRVMDALSGTGDEDVADLRPAFAAALRRAREQAQRGDTATLASFPSASARLPSA